MFAGASTESSPWVCGGETWERDREKKKKAQRDTVTERWKPTTHSSHSPSEKTLAEYKGELMGKSLPPTHCQDSAKTVFGGHHAEQPIPAERFITGPGPPTETNTIRFAWAWPFSTRFNGGAFVQCLLAHFRKCSSQVGLCYFSGRIHRGKLCGKQDVCKFTQWNN